MMKLMIKSLPLSIFVKGNLSRRNPRKGRQKTKTTTIQTINSEQDAKDAVDAWDMDSACLVRSLDQVGASYSRHLLEVFKPRLSPQIVLKKTDIFKKQTAILNKKPTKPVQA